MFHLSTLVRRAWLPCALLLPTLASAQLPLPSPSPSPSPASPGPVAIQLNRYGLTSLTVGGQQWLGVRDKGALVGDFFTSVWRNGASQSNYEGRLTSTLSGNTTQQTYPWGSASCTYTVADAHTLRFDVSVTNHDPTPLTKIQLVLGDVRFPGSATPSGWNDNAPPSADSSNAPPVLLGDYGKAVLAFFNEKIEDPEVTQFQFKYQGGYPLRVTSYEPLAAGATMTFQVDLRWGPEGATKSQMAPEVWQGFQALHHQELRWPDRRPIGTIYLASVNRNYPNNPRGWFNDQSININTPAGLASLKTRLYQLANDSVSNMQFVDAQGCVVWDVEGEQFPQGSATYIGDPSRVKEFAPEMDAIADGFFKILKDSGRRVGVCLRCQYLARASGGDWVQREYATNDDLFNALDGRIAYAQKRWGCTLFYVDSNGGVKGLYDASVFKKLMEKHPDVLLMPELQNTIYYAYTAPYDEFRALPGIPPTYTTSPSVRSVLPGAFTAINTADGDFANHRNDLVPAVRNGDTLMYRTWFHGPENDFVKGIYGEAYANGGPVAVPDVYVVKPGVDTVLDVTTNDFTRASGRAPFQVTSVTQPEVGGGLVYLLDGAVHYVSPPLHPLNATGFFHFTYTVSDGVSTSTAAVTVNVGA